MTNHILTDPRVQAAWARVLRAYDSYGRAVAEAATDPQPLPVPAEAVAIAGEWFAYHHGYPTGDATLEDLRKRLLSAGIPLEVSAAPFPTLGHDQEEPDQDATIAAGVPLSLTREERDDERDEGANAVILAGTHQAAPSCVRHSQNRDWCTTHGAWFAGHTEVHQP